MADPQPLCSRPELERHCLVSSPAGLSTTDVKRALTVDVIDPSNFKNNDGSKSGKRKLSRNVSLARIQQELKEFEQDPPSYCWAGLKDPISFKRQRSLLDEEMAGNGRLGDEYLGWVESHHRWEAMINGPKGTPYEGGIFFLDIDLPKRYPFEAPKIKFTTPIYHCNVRSDGRICMGLLGFEEWRPAQSISGVLLGIVSLLNDPETKTTDDDTFSDNARMELILSNRSNFDEMAREWTRKYAM